MALRDWQELKTPAIASGPHIFSLKGIEGLPDELSGLLIENSGQSLIAVSDHGILITADILRTNSEITGLSNVTSFGLEGAGALPLTKFQSDAEGLTRTKSGDIVVSFESYTRIKRYEAPGAEQQSTHPWDLFMAYWDNRSFEAIASLANDDLIVFTESTGWSKTTNYFVKTGEDPWAGPFQLTKPWTYTVAGAELGPRGCLYILQRKATMINWFSTEVRRISLRGGNLYDEVILRTKSGQIGNAEGISIWDDSDGTSWITLVTDNGFPPFAETQLIEYELSSKDQCQTDQITFPIDFDESGKP